VVKIKSIKTEIRALQRGSPIKSFLFLGGITGLLLARHNIQFIMVFIVCYFLLVYITYFKKSRFGLILCSVSSSLILALRFRYLTWGDPWFEYAMILDIMKGGMLSMEFYSDQEPLLHTIIAATSTYTDLGAMQLQKFLVPSLSFISILALYRIAKEFFDEETAIASALLLSVGTAYLHWTAQAVCESLGISLSILALYVSYRSLRDIKYLPAAALLIVGLVLAHHFSTLIFLAWWNSFSLAYIYLISQKKSEAVVGLFISVFSFLSALIWWSLRLPNIYNAVKSPLIGLFHTDQAIYSVFMILIVLYAIPFLLPGVTNLIRSAADQLFQFRNCIYFGIILMSIAGVVLALNFLLGRSFFVLSYPPLFFSNGLLMIFLAIVGFRSFLYKEKIPILAWSGGVGMMLIGSIIGIYRAEDPLRFIEFIYPSLSIISAVGLITLARNLGPKRKAALVASICLFSLIVAFPSTVFWGETYPPTDPRHDTRALVISHPDSEIMAIDFIDQHVVTGNLYTDRYAGYASKHLDNVTVRYDNRPDPNKLASHHDLALITHRMRKYAEFGEWLLKEKFPLKENELKRIDENASRIYDDGESWVYSG
jgi:hypothetical protein